MKHYRYKLVDFLSEAQQDFADTKQFYGGDSDKGIQAGKPGNVDFNRKAIADVIATGVKVYNDARAATQTIKKNTKVSKKVDLSDLKNPTAAGKISYKSAGLSGVVDVKGNLDANFKIKLGDPTRYFSAKMSGNVSNLEDMYNNPFSLTFVDKEGKKNNFDIEINPDKNYAFSYNKSGNTLGEKGENTGQFNFGFNVNVPKDASKTSAGLSAEFNSNDDKSYSAALAYGGEGTEVTLGFAKTLDGDKISLIGGTGSTATLNLNTFVSTNFGEERGVGVGAGAQLTITGKKKEKDKTPQDTVGKKATQVMQKAKEYTYFGDETKPGGLKTVIGKDGEEVTKVQKQVDNITQDIKGASKAAKDVVKDVVKENTITIAKKDLNMLIEKLLN
jgi:hypothetical protein